MFRPVDAASISSRSRNACSLAGATTTCSAHRSATAHGRAGVGVLRGPAHRQRPARHPPRLGPALQGPLSPLPHHARQARRAQGRLGLPRPARSRCRSRRSSASRASTRSRTTASSASTRSAARRCSATSRTGSRSRPASACGSTPPARTGRCPTSTSRACGGCSTRCGTRTTIYEGYKVVPYCGRCGTALSIARARPARRVPRRHRAVGVRALPGRRPRRRPARVDHHAVDAAVEHRRRGRPRHRVRARAAPEGGRDLVMARDRVAAVLGDDAEIVGDVPVAELVGARYEPPFTLVARRRAKAFRVVADDFVTVEDGSGIVHLAPAFGEIDREVGEREGLPHRQPGQRRGPLRRRRGRAVRGQVREGRRPRAHRRSRRRGQARAGRRLHALVPALLALRHAAHLLGQAHVVRAHVGATRTRCSARTRRSTGIPSTSSTAASATGSRTTSTGRSRAIATGARRSRCGGAATAATTRASARSPSCRSSRAATSPAWTCTARTSTTSRSRARSARTAPRTASSRCSTRGSTRARCRPRSSTIRSRTGHVRIALPRRLHLRGDRPDARLVLLAARSEHARVRQVPVPQRRVPRAHRRPGRAEDVEVAGQHHRPVCRCSRERGADALRWYMFSSGSPWTPKRVYDGRHRRGDPPVPAHAVEHVLVLRDLRDDLDGWQPPAHRLPRPHTCSTAGFARGCTAPCAR